MNNIVSALESSMVMNDTRFMPVDFVERKTLDLKRIEALLSDSDTLNQWSNRGPNWYRLAEAYYEYFGSPEGLCVIPCANGGIALTALAQMHAVRTQKPLRWVVSAFGFYNTGRGVFADAQKVDCNENGVLSVDALRQLDTDSYDGIVVTNPFGLANDFTALQYYADQHNKVMMIDNAAGTRRYIPDCPYQSFSLHQTKPYGLGEGGLILVPEAYKTNILELLEYTPLSEMARKFWVNNGKVSELACAAHLSRLETADEWTVRYREQADRIKMIAQSVGLKPMIDSLDHVVSTSLPFLAKSSIPIEEMKNGWFTIAKYYKPLEPLPMAETIFSHIMNIPSHPDMARISDDRLYAILLSIVERKSFQK